MLAILFLNDRGRRFCIDSVGIGNILWTSDSDVCLVKIYAL